MKKKQNKKYSIDRGQKTGTCKNSGQKKSMQQGKVRNPEGLKLVRGASKEMHEKRGKIV